ncbi:MAG: SulP family inorganic anion transporter, partial [Clostridia bacterium]|nr:SulP family inorganic anion transporter [Clostridia bacterium]
DKLKAFFANIGTVNFTALALGAVCLAIILLMPKVKYIGKIPASLVVVIIGAVAVSAFKLNVNTIGDLYTVRAGLPKLTLPTFSGKELLAVLPDGVIIAVAAAIESLLSCVVADDMTGSRHRSDTELIAQGLGNIGSVLFGGIPATGAIARTAANIKNGGTSPIAGIVHAVVLLLVLVVFMPYAALIPMPVIAAILFSVSFNMARLGVFGNLFKTENVGGKIVLVLTFILTVVFNLVVAVAAGVVLSLIFKAFSKKK